jgi:hypothetical protein
MKNSKWSSKIRLKLKVPRKSVEPRRKLYSAEVMDSREKVRGKRTRRVLHTIRGESRKQFTRFAASAERNLILRCWKWWFPEVLGCFARFSHFLIFGWFWWWISIPLHVFLTRDGPILLFFSLWTYPKAIWDHPWSGKHVRELKFTTKTNQIWENEKIEQNTPKLQEIIIFNTLKSNFALLTRQIV